MRGLKTQEGRKFERFFNIVQNEAAKQDAVFFLGCGEGRDFSTNEMEGEDLMGWLMPKSNAAKFELEWEEDNVGERWNNFVRFAIWELRDGELIVTFEKY